MILLIFVHIAVAKYSLVEYFLILCRYTQAATIPKSVVILVDRSGSMTGLRMEIAKTLVKKILESLQENDFFNIIAVS